MSKQHVWCSIGFAKVDVQVRAATTHALQVLWTVAAAAGDMYFVTVPSRGASLRESGTRWYALSSMLQCALDQAAGCVQPAQVLKLAFWEPAAFDDAGGVSAAQVTPSWT
jgi:hypothetical protein